MPELPEVETVRRSLAERCCHKQIGEVIVHNDQVLANRGSGEFSAILRERVIVELQRRGKYLLFLLDNDAVLVLHLRMTGQIIYYEGDPPQDKHCHLVISLAGGCGLYYRDVRRFGRFWLYESGECYEEGGLATLGPEPFDEEFTVPYLQAGLRKRRCTVKERVLDQTFIAGIGNIYADETLFAAGINPLRRCDTLTEGEVRALHAAAISVLTEAVAKRGTTIRDYRDGNDEEGNFQRYLRVFGRGGETCQHCGTILIKCKCGGRGTTYCPQCQPEVTPCEPSA